MKYQANYLQVSSICEEPIGLIKKTEFGANNFSSIAVSNLTYRFACVINLVVEVVQVVLSSFDRFADQMKHGVLLRLRFCNL